MVFTMLAPMNVSANDDAKPFKQNGPSESTMQLKAAIAEQLNLLKADNPTQRFTRFIRKSRCSSNRSFI